MPQAGSQRPASFCQDAEAMAFFERRTEELLELQQLTGMDTRWMIRQGLLHGATWGLGRV